MAKESIDSSLAINKKFGDELLKTWAHFLLGKIYSLEGDYQKAEYSFNQFIKYT